MSEAETPAVQPGFDETCARLDTILAGAMRRELVAGLAASKDLRSALVRLRESMRSHAWGPEGRRVGLGRAVRAYDARTRAEGFHALHDWDGVAERVNDDSIPVDVLHYLIDQRGSGKADASVLAILIDYYFQHLLGLLSLRVWDEGRPDEHLDRLDALLSALQGPDGSGQQFVDNAETLLLVATSHYEPFDQGYDTLLAKSREVNRTHRARMAIGHAATIGCHLRFGIEATYGRDIGAMRDDNGVDYRWLCFALDIVMDEYVRLAAEGRQGVERDVVVEAMLNGLSADAGAFVLKPPASLAPCETERARFCTAFDQHRDALLEEFERVRPTEQAYSPISFFFNFSHNVLKGTVIDALLWAEPWTLTLNDLVTGVPRSGPNGEARLKLANTLMGYARASPDKIRGRLTPVIVYDSTAGRRAFAATMRALKASGEATP
jgi:hypothetical protein